MRHRLYGIRGGVTGRDRISATVEMSRFEMGARVVMDGTPVSKPVPFTIGPLKGVAFVTNGNQLELREGAMLLSFELDLVPDEEITLAKALEEFFGAEIAKEYE